MAYKVDRYNGTFLVSVEDGTIDTTTDIRLLGKNYAGYGEVQNENFVHLLENFANTTAPPRPLTGQIWYDSNNKKIKFYDGTRFRTTGGSEVGPVAPTGLGAGDFWLDTSTDQLYVNNGTSFVLVGPQITEDLGATALEVVIVKDIFNINHQIIKFKVSGDTMVIASRTEFTLNSAVNPIAGFDVIKKGFTLINTPVDGITTTDHYWWGTASNSLRLGGYLAEEYVRKSNAQFPNGAKFFDIGFTVGDSDDLRVFIENGDQPIISNQLGSSGSQNITVRIVTTEEDKDYVFNQNAFYPGTDNLLNCGLNGARWANVYAVTFRGNLIGNLTGNIVSTTGFNVLTPGTTSGTAVYTGTVTGNVTGNLTGNVTGNVTGNLTGTANNALQLTNKSPDTAATANTVAVRDASGNLTANQFIGTAAKADRLKIDNSATDTDPSYRSAKTTSSASTIVARDASSNIYCNILHGTATSARYADLAEKYVPDQNYEVGTVVVIGGDKEITACSEGQRAVGAISLNPAFRMNMELFGGVYVALKGRVPVKVLGKVKKGDNLIAAENGSAKAVDYHSVNTFAVALADSDDEGTKLVEALVL